MSVAWRLEPSPFFEPRHYALAEKLCEWRSQNAELVDHHDDTDLEPHCRDLLRRMAAWGLLDYVVPDAAHSADTRLDIRSICLIREALAFDSCLADTMFVMQGLGLSPLWSHPDEALRRRYLEPARRGETIAALAMTEPEAGSDAAGIATTATRDGDDYVLNGSKVWISNAGMADYYLVIARTGEAPGSRGLSAFMLDADAPGLTCGPQRAMIAAHPIAPLTFENCRVSAKRMVGEPGRGFKSAMMGFDVFRPTVGAAAVGVARRAMAEALERVKTRRMFGKTMAEMESVQNRIADMACDTETAALSVYKAAWAADVVGGRISGTSAMGKLIATEAAQRVTDAAVQLFGALGVARGSVVEQLYRDIRPMRIYEGASEIQKIIIARSVLGTSAR